MANTFCNLEYVVNCATADHPTVSIEYLDTDGNAAKDPVVLLKGTLFAEVDFKNETVVLKGLNKLFKPQEVELPASNSYTNCTIGAGPALNASVLPPNCVGLDVNNLSQGFLDLYDCVVTNCANSCCP